MSPSSPSWFYVLKLTGNSPEAARLQVRNAFFDLLGEAPIDKPNILQQLLEKEDVKGNWSAIHAAVEAIPAGKMERIHL